MKNKSIAAMKSVLSVLTATILLGIVTTSLAYNNTLTATNMAELQSLNVQALINAGYTNPTVFVRGYYTPGDRGGGMFEWNRSSTANPDGGRYFTTNGWTSGAGRWVRQLNGETANVKMWGAKGDWHRWFDYTGAFAHDDTTNIQNALYAVTSTGMDSDANTPWTKELLFPGGWYKVTDTLVWNPQQAKLRGEHSQFAELIMPSEILKDILRGQVADQFLKGQTPADPSDQMVRIEDLSFSFHGWETNTYVNPTNACLVISAPQEGNAIHNVSTFGGAYGIRCFNGGNGAPFALRDVCAHYATVAGVCIEPYPGSTSCGGHVSILGITGDYFIGTPPSSASLVKFVNYVGPAVIDDLNAEGNYGGGVIQHKFPDSGAGWSVGGVLIIRNGQFNGTTGFQYNDFIVLKGGQRTASVSIQNPLYLYTGGSLIRDDVSGRKVPADVAVYSGLAQTAARLPITYEGSNDGSTNTILGKRSMLASGNTAIYSFIPTNTGWYRIMAPMGGGIGLLSGKLTIRSYYREGSEVEANGNPQGDVWLNVLRSSKNNASLPPLVTKARAFTYWAGSEGYNSYWCGVDVYVANVITNAYRDVEKRLVFSLPMDGVLEPDGNVQQLLSPTTPVSTGSGDTDGLPSGANYTVVPVVR